MSSAFIWSASGRANVAGLDADRLDQLASAIARVCIALSSRAPPRPVNEAVLTDRGLL